MGGGIRFLERLAPAATTTGAQVYAPAPPRFAPWTPELQPDEEQVSVPAAPDRETSDQSPSRVTPAMNVRPTAAAAVERARSSIVVAAPRSDSNRAAPPEQSNALTSVIARDSTMNVSATPSPAASGAPAASSVAAPRASASRSRSPALSVIASAPPRSEAELSDAAVARPPLRERTVAQVSAQPRAERQPVVHVTIDRIEVRSPAARPAASAAPKSKPRTPSSKALGDYLRERDRGAAP
jgi:hypothetical protein